MSVLFALASAVAFGISDFLGGMLSRRLSVWKVAFAMQLTATTLLLGFSIADPVLPTMAAVWWAVGAGSANGIGTVSLYRGLAIGRMGVVAPVSGALAATFPVFVGVALGERPSTWAWLGVALALPGIWLVARTPPTATDGSYSGLAEGLVAGANFGFLFVFLAQIPPDSGWLPLAITEGLAAVIVVVVAQAAGQPWVPGDRELWPAVVLGVLVAGAMVAFVAATQRGYLSISSVLSSLYPGVTVVLAILINQERVHRAQLVGLLLCGVAVGLVATG